MCMRHCCRLSSSVYRFVAGDLWTVVCSSTYWRRTEKVRLKHFVTN